MSMREFTKISPTIWQSRRFRSLRSDDDRYLFLYLLTCPHINSAGCFWLPDGYALRDLGWSRDRYEKARHSLHEAGLIDFDLEEECVLIERWYRHNLPMNKSHRKGTLIQLGKVPSERLREKAYAALVEAEASREALKTREAQRSDANSEASFAVTEKHLKTGYMTGARRR